MGNLGVMKPPRAPWKKAPELRRRTFLTEWREFRGMTLEVLAEKMGTSKGIISRYENKEIAYNQDFLERAAELLGIHESVLLARAPNESDRITPPPPKSGRKASK